MKKLVKLLLCMTLVLALTGCGKEQSATYKMEQDLGGMVLVDTQIISAKGDKVVRMEEVTEIKMDGATDEEKALVAEQYDAVYGPMKDSAPEGVKMEYGLEGDVYKITLDMDIANADLKKLVDGGFIYLNTDSDKVLMLSFKQTCDALEASGYTAQ